MTRNERVWEVTVEAIQLNPESRFIVELSTEELIEAIQQDGVDHIIEIKNLRG